MGLFKKKEYVDEIIPQITGQERELIITLKNMPVRKEALTSRLENHPDFGCGLAEELLGNDRVPFEEVKQTLQSGNKYNVSFHVHRLPEMSIEISGAVPKNKSQFESDLLGAIASAWKQNNIKS